MLYPKIPLAQNLIEICKQKGLEHIVISPGSRNAPLTIGFTNQKEFTCYSIADERCAAFFALGIAQQIQKPVAIVCTSGSALLNYYPAFAEAFYSQIPLVVISADRPQSKIDIGDGQTIRQENVFANHSLYNANLTEDVSNENDYKIQEALFVAASQKGPVHINVPFEEPLYETVTEVTQVPTKVDFKKLNSEFELDNKFKDIWNSSSKKMILVGELFPNSLEQELINRLVEDESVIVLTETTSNLHHKDIISKIDTFITPFNEKELKKLQPEILLTFGGMVVSKRIKAFLRNYQPAYHWHIDTLRAYDTFNVLSHHFKTDISTFLNVLNLKNCSTSFYKKEIHEIWNLRKIQHDKFVNQVEFSDFKVFDFLSKNLPSNIHLQISNSSAIRYVQLFDFKSSIEMFCNRGTSGIDGSTSTAIGASIYNEKSTFLITGDISFLYDSNALWNNYIPQNFKIILMNNRGGGIFRILPGHQENETFNTYFETSHQLTAEYLAKMYQFSYFKVTDDNELGLVWNNFNNESKPSIIEIFTPEKINDKVLKDYFTSLK